MSTNPYAGMRSAAPYDARSVAALVLLGTLALAPVSVVLGVLGLRRTRHGARRGRWCAVLGVVGGLVLTTGLAAGTLLRPWVQDQVDPFHAIGTGDCVDVGSASPVAIEKRPCDGAHDAEVVHRGSFDSYLVRRFEDVWADQFCTPFAAEHLASAFLTGDYSLRVILIGDADGPREGQDFLCLTQRADGRTLSHQVGVNV